jgi:hypothetical protein
MLTNLKLNFLMGYRKVWIMGAITLLSVLLRVGNYIDGSQLVDLLKVCAVAFFGANLTEHIVSGTKTYLENKNRGESND